MDENAFDVTVIGTGLPESIAAAALSKAGLRVLHIDTDANYGSSDATLNLIELHHLVMSPPSYLADISAPIPIPEALLRESRNYAISLAPSVVPSVGPLIDALVKSGVSRYVKFKLLDGVGLYTQIPDSSKDDQSENLDGISVSVGSVKTVPGSKEDVFKNKELGLLQKRKLMKFLMGTASQTSSLPNTTPFLEYLRSREVGLEPGVADAVAYALSLSSDAVEPSGHAIKRLRKYILSTGRHGNSPFLIGHFGGAGEIAQGFCRAAAVSGATYILGRPFNISQRETTTDLQNPFQLSFEGIDDILTSRCTLSRQSNLPSGLLHDSYRAESESGTATAARLARCIAVIEGPVYFAKQSPEQSEGQTELDLEDEEDEDVGRGIVDSAILVFPPGSLVPLNVVTQVSGEIGVVTAFIAGPNALACPDGKRVIYLTTEIPPTASPEAILQPYLTAIQYLNRPKDDDPAAVLMSLFYTQALPPRPFPVVPNILPVAPNNIHAAQQAFTASFTRTTATVPVPSTAVASRPTSRVPMLVPLHPPTSHLAEFGDEAAEEAERAFWAVVEGLDLGGRAPVVYTAGQGQGHAQAVDGDLGSGIEDGKFIPVETLEVESEAGVDRGEVDGGLEPPRAGGGRGVGQEDSIAVEVEGEEIERISVMWPRLAIEENGGDDGW